MNINTLKNDFLLLLTAIIWGFAFTAQRAGMEFIGPFTFNGIRFLIGSISILPLIFLDTKNKLRKMSSIAQSSINRSSPKTLFIYGVVGGFLLYLGASLQQIGIVYTSAGKASGAVLSITGLYFLSVRGSISINKGDIFVLLSAFFWASHVIAISHFSLKVNALKLAFIQYVLCGALSLITAFLHEYMSWILIMQAWIPILYGSLFSVGIAYTIQIFAQKKANPAHAAIILSLEGVFAVIGGWLILGESLGFKGLLGCGLMLGGMFISQSKTIARPRINNNNNMK